uniref:Pheromone peptide ILME n=1 Tax=Sepia officinalis TaxID=6610 RepID=ILME_SEPOF
ILME